MTVQFRFGILFCLFLVIAVFFAGCSDDSAESVETPVPTTAPLALHSAGDIIAKTASGGESQLYVILKYDSAKDEYERAWIYKNTDGKWGHFIDSRTESAARTIIDKVYPVTVSHITVSSVPVITPTIVTAVPTSVSSVPPSVTGISPTSGARDTTVTVTITGTNFLTGATPKLMLPGDQPVTGSAVSVSSTSITCSFNLDGLSAGNYNVVVSNPDGQSGTFQRGFTVGDAAPIISSITPYELEMDSQTGLVISGQNFKEGVKVLLIRDSAEIPCASPVSTGGIRISCDLDLSTTRFPQVAFGEWDVKVINIEGSESGTWIKKFTIQNVTSTSED